MIKCIEFYVQQLPNLEIRVNDSLYERKWINETYISFLWAIMYFCLTCSIMNFISTISIVHEMKSLISFSRSTINIVIHSLQYNVLLLSIVELNNRVTYIFRFDHWTRSCIKQQGEQLLLDDFLALIPCCISLIARKVFQPITITMILKLRISNY